ncbi:MAG: transglutaminase domain-containing protein [Candidatus Gracilibacteria bacterium]|nr:transglutaminase domain-containing protein [Candidatus Gracilibacteria bacterium]
MLSNQSEVPGFRENDELPDKPQKLQPNKDTSLSFLDQHGAALHHEDYEEAVESLSSVEEYLKFRNEVRYFPSKSIIESIEGLALLQRMEASPQQIDQKTQEFLYTMAEKSKRLSPRVSDFLQAIISTRQGDKIDPKFEQVTNKIHELVSSGDFNQLFSGKSSWKIIENRAKACLKDFLKALKYLDKVDGNTSDDDETKKHRQEELSKAPTQVPPRNNTSKPGVDAMSRLNEGEKVKALWTIDPAYGGYYKKQSFSVWNEQIKSWEEPKSTYSELQLIPLCSEENPSRGYMNIQLNAQCPTNTWVGVPIPYTHSLSKVEAENRNVSMQKDQNGDVVLFISGSGQSVSTSLMLSPNKRKKFTSKNPKSQQISTVFTEETTQKINEIQQNKTGNIARAYALSAYVRQRISYLKPKDQQEADEYNEKYRKHSLGFARAVDEIKEADCDVANTYFAAMCSKLQIPVRHCVGHSVTGKNETGQAMIHSGTGHAWSEVWDEKNCLWIRIDATPAGDPLLEDDEDDADQPENESMPGDYGEKEAVVPTLEELEELEKKLKEWTKNLSYTREERFLAESTGVELKEARQIVKEIHTAEQEKLPNGERIIDALSRLFNALVESRKSHQIEYDGPVRRRDGGVQITNIVRHKIGILARNQDPVSRSKPEREKKEEEIMGGFDVYIIGDKSGSMRSTSEGEELWQIQRKTEYLIFRSLHRLQSKLEKASLQKGNELTVRTQAISFRGSKSSEIDMDKPLSSVFTESDKVKMWHSLTGANGGNGDPAALASIYEQIKEEREMLKNEKKKDTRIRLVLACSDGGYIGNEAGQMQMISEQLANEGVVVVGLGMGEAARSVETVMNTQWSKGVLIPNVSDLPKIIAKSIIETVIQLFPEKSRSDAQHIIDTLLNSS